MRGNASGQRVKRATQVRRYIKPCDGGRGPTISTGILSNHVSETGKEERSDCMVSYFGKLTRETRMSPFLIVRVHFWPEKMGRDKLLGSPMPG